MGDFEMTYKRNPRAESEAAGVYVRMVFERRAFEAPITRCWPLSSAAAISGVGLVILLGAISKTGLF
jgi:hypothetical protein